jgi:phosphoserine phosphatase
MTIRKFVLVSFDVDKTLYRKPALTTAAKALGIGEKWDALDELERKKRITIGHCLTSQFKLLVGMKLEDIIREVSKVEMMRNIRETVDRLLGLGLQVILTTDNPDFLCQFLVERFGFNGYVSSKVAVKNGVVVDEIEPLPDKRLGIRKYCAWMSVPLSKVVHVGDGPNDVPVFRAVGYSIAINTDIDKVLNTATHRMKTDNLLDVYNHIHSIIGTPTLVN